MRTVCWNGLDHLNSFFLKLRNGCDFENLRHWRIYDLCTL